jgi:uncharacterized damage-inducible protein DinB
MLAKNSLLEMYRYNAYANRLVLNEIEKLSDEEFNRTTSPSQGSVHQLLRHLLRSEVFFLAVCAGEKPNPPDPVMAADFRALINYIEEIAATLLADIDEIGLQQVVPFDLHATILHFPVWQLLVQAYTHATHHRGELSIVLTELGFPLPTLDIIIFFAAESGQPWPVL